MKKRFIQVIAVITFVLAGYANSEAKPGYGPDVQLVPPPGMTVAEAKKARKAAKRRMMPARPAKYRTNGTGDASDGAVGTSDEAFDEFQEGINLQLSSLSPMYYKENFVEGDKVRIKGYVQNSGTVDCSQSIVIRSTVKKGNEYVTNDLVLGSLKAGECGNFLMEVDLSDIIKPGRCRLFLTIDPDNQIAEYNEEDNELEYKEDLIIRSKADRKISELAVVKVSPSTVLVEPSGLVTVTVEVANVGEVEATDYDVMVRMVTNKGFFNPNSNVKSQINGGPIFSSKISGTPLAAGESKEYTFTANVKNKLDDVRPVGIVKTNKSKGDWEKNNNKLAGEVIKIRENQPMVFVSRGGASNTLVGPNDELEVDYKLYNDGMVDAGAFDIVLSLEKGQKVIEVDRKTIPGLKAQEIVRGVIGGKKGSELELGNYKLILELDPEDAALAGSKKIKRYISKYGDKDRQHIKVVNHEWRGIGE